MKKKLFLIVSLCVFMLGLTACGEDPKKADYNGVTYDELESNSQGIASTLVTLSDEEVDSFIEQNAGNVTAGLLERWKELKPDLGEYVDLGEFSIDKSGKTLTTSQILDFTERDITLTCVFNYLDMNVTDITLDENYSLGEKMQKAAMNTLMGLGTVFGILILISLIIWAFKIIQYLEKQSKEKNAPAPVEEKPQAAPVTAPVVEVPPETDDLELIAVISAAIAAAASETGTQAPADGFVVRSIKRRTQ